MFHIRASYRLPSLSFHDNQASYSQDTNWPWKFKVKGQCQRYPSQRSIQLTHFLSVSHQGILSTPVSFVPWQSGLQFPRYNLTLKIQDQRSRSKVKAKGTIVSVASSRLLSFSFHINWANQIWQIECSTGKNGFEILSKNLLKNYFLTEFSQNLTRWKTWPWPKVTEIGANNSFNTHRLTMCGLKKLASGVFPENWEVLAEQRRRRQKRTKNNKCPSYPGWLN